jgi:RHS repeat-associated protein
MAMRKYRNLKSLTVTFLFLLISILTVSHEAYPGNWEWDQNHDCVEGIRGKSGWCKWGYDGNPADCDAISIECCELLCKICPVYAYSGRYQKTFTDLTVPGVGPTLAITRTYNSQEWSSSLLGYSWTFNFGRKLIITRNMHGEKIIGVLLETGEKNYYREETDGALTRLTNFGATYELLKNGDNTYTIVNRDGTSYELRQDGKIDKIIDKNNNELVFTYNTVGCLSRITNASGNYVDFQLGPNGKIASVSDNLGRTISYTYDQNGNLISATDPLGNTTQYVYNTNNFLTQIIDARGNVVETAGYDNHEPPRVSTFVEKGETYTIAYFDGRTEKTDSQGNKWTYYFNDVGIIERVVDPLGNETNQQPNKVTSTSVEWEEDANGNRTTYTYDTDGNIASKTDSLGNTWTYTYIAGTDLLATETNPLGVVTKYEYDGNGNQTAIIRDFGGPLQNRSSYTYDSQGKQTSITDPLGNTTTYEYDANGNLIRVTDPLGNVTTYTYDSRGKRLTETDANGNTTIYAYDLLDRLASVTNPMGHVASYTYDAADNMVAIQLPNGEKITQEYDAYNRLTRTTDPLGHSQTYAYDHNDNLITVTDANGNTSIYSYDVIGRRISMTDAEGHTTTFAYDPAENMVSLTDANGQTTNLSYDVLNRMVAKTYPDGMSHAYNYDAIGRKVSQTDPNGNTINYNYDRLNRLAQKQYPDARNADFTYDLGGRVLTGTSPDSIIAYAYDSAGHILTATQNGKTISYGYDTSGNRISMTTPEGEVIQYAYNNANFMTSVQLSNGKGISYTYNAFGRVTRQDYSGGVYATIAFDNAGRLVDISYKKSDGTPIYTQNNVLDNMSNIVQKTTETGATSYTYDKTYQLTAADHPVMADEQHTYDPMGNRLNSADFNDWTYNNRNELQTYDGVTFTYDANGNTISKTDASGTITYHYNFENRLIRVDLPGGGVVTYKYDVLGRRVEKDVNGVVTTYLYDGNTLLTEYDDTGNLSRNYFTGARDMNPSMLVEGGHVYFYVKDHLDTPKKVVDESGDINWAAEYKSFGEVSVSVNTVTNNFRFPGQYWDSETGLHYNWHRYYDTGIGRYLREDPIGLMGGINLFVYSYNNPINYSDPTGEYSNPTGEIPEHCQEGYCPGGQWINTFGGLGGGLIGYLEGGVMTAQCVNRPTLTRSLSYFCIGIGAVGGVSAFAGPGTTSGAYTASKLTGWMFGTTLEGGVGVGMGVVALKNGEVHFVAPFVSTGEEVGVAFIACYSWFVN